MSLTISRIKRFVIGREYLLKSTMNFRENLVLILTRCIFSNILIMMKIKSEDVVMSRHVVWVEK